MDRRLMTAFAAFTSAIVLAATLAAQQSATVYLKSGEQVSGDLIDLSARGFSMRVNGQDRDVARGDVAMIDFGSGDFTRPSQLNELSEGQNIAVLRNGEVVVGQFMDIGGRAPLRLTFSTANGERVLSGGDVRRIYLSRTDAGGGTSSTASAAGGQSVRVPSTTAWTSTGITVRQGQTVRFEATGEVTTAEGATGGPSGNGRFDRSDPPIPSAQMGALIGRIGSGGGRFGARSSTFMIGDQRSVVMPADGVLFLGVNDSGLRDNRGHFDVKVAVD